MGAVFAQAGDQVAHFMAAPAVIAVGYETGGYRDVEADVQRKG